MSKKERHFRFDEFTVLEVFLAVTLFGLVAGAVFSVLFPGIVTGPVAVVTAPTDDEYRAQASEIMLPFLAQATTMTAEDFGNEADAPLAELAAKTQERMLRLRVPSEYRDTHLSVVLLLDQWKRVLSGADRDPAAVLAKTGEVLEADPWLMDGAGMDASHEQEIEAEESAL